MRRNTLNFVLDAVTLLGMLALISSGFLMRWILPPGSRGGGGKSLWGWGRHDIGDLHYYIAAGLIALLALHVALHWAWVCGIVRHWARRKGEEISRIRPLTRNLAGAAFLTVIVLGVGGFLIGAHASVESGGNEPAGEARRAGAESGGVCSEEQRIRCGEIEKPASTPAQRLAQPRSNSSRRNASSAAARFEVRGSTSLGEAADMAGVTVEQLRTRLKLPKCARSDERLADLCREHGFSMSDVRRAVNEIANKRPKRVDGQ